MLPADVVVLSAIAHGKPSDKCYVSTLGLDGETNAKIKRVPFANSLLPSVLAGTVQSEQPNKDLTRCREKKEEKKNSF